MTDKKKKEGNVHSVVQYNQPKNSTPPRTYFLVTNAVFVADETALTNSNITFVFSACSNNTHDNNPSDTTNNSLDILVCGFMQL